MRRPFGALASFQILFGNMRRVAREFYGSVRRGRLTLHERSSVARPRTSHFRRTANRNRKMAELPKLYCVIPFRQAGTQVEFCLVRPLPTMAHWDFPKTQVLDGECGRSAVLREVEATLG